MITSTCSEKWTPTERRSPGQLDDSHQSYSALASALVREWIFHQCCRWRTAYSFDSRLALAARLHPTPLVHGESRIGDTIVPAFCRLSGWPVMPSILLVYIPDADARHGRRRAPGTAIVLACHFCQHQFVK